MERTQKPLFLYDFFGEGWIKQTVCDVYKPNAIVRLELSTFNAQVGVFSADNLWISHGCGYTPIKTFTIALAAFDPEIGVGLQFRA